MPRQPSPPRCARGACPAPGLVWADMAPVLQKSRPPGRRLNHGAPIRLSCFPPWDRGRTTCRAAEISAWLMYFIHTPIVYYSIRSNRRSGDVPSPNITLGLFKEADGLAPRIDAYVGRVLQLPAHQDATARLHAEEDGPDASAAQPERGPVTAPGRARGVGGHRAGTEPRGPKGPPPCSGRAAPTMLGVRPPRSGSFAAA